MAEQVGVHKSLLVKTSTHYSKKNLLEDVDWSEPLQVRLARCRLPVAVARPSCQLPGPRGSEAFGRVPKPSLSTRT